MIKVDSRESAHVKSRVQDLSVVPNLVSFTGLFAAITPIAKAEKNSDKLYEPVLVRDVESLIANFGDPRIDPEKYIDLYSIMQIVGNGASCYVAKVDSGTQGVYHFHFIPNAIPAKELQTDPDNPRAVYTVTDTPVYPTSLSVTGFGEISDGVFGINLTDPAQAAAHLSTEGDTQVLILKLEDLKKVEVAPDEDEEGKFRTTVTFKDGYDIPVGAEIKINSFQSTPSLIGYSSMTEKLDFACKLVQAKPLSLKVFYLTVDVLNESKDILCSAKVKLEPTTTNQSIVNNLNSSLGTYVRFELGEDGLDYANAAEVNDMRDRSIANVLLDVYAPHTGTVNNTAEPNRKSPRANLELNGGSYEVVLPRNNADTGDVKDVDPKFKVMLQDYIDTLNQYRDKRYAGCLMADFTAPVSHYLKDGEPARVDGATDDTPITVMPLDPEERRSLHFYLKQIACERKDTTVILSTPYANGYGDAAGTFFKMDEVCDWVASRGDYENLWSYGETNTTDYAQQSFYLEIYYSWLKLKCTKVANGLATSVDVNVAPANVVVNNILTSWRERGVQYPVAGDQYGTLTDQCSVLQNPKTKLERDQLVQYRINPIWDTGTRGVQIYGNETLNAGYTDLNAAHIARALVYIRSHIDEYTERLKFSINSIVLWDTWKNHVTQFLESMKTSNCLSEYRVLMGTETTSAAEIANRKVNGLIQLIFYQSAEIFDLTYTIYSSSTTIDEATANQ